MSEVWLGMSNEELLTHLAQTPGHSGMRHELAKALLEVRLMEAQGKASEELVTATKRLASFTGALVAATVALVLVTAVLVWITSTHGG